MAAYGWEARRLQLQNVDFFPPLREFFARRPDELRAEFANLLP